MSKTVPLSARIDAAVDKRLRKLSAATRRSKSFLVGEAIARFTESELEYLESIEEGRARFRAGEFLEQEDVLRGIKARAATRARAKGRKT
jgi:predicted transcriptional regulator